MRANHQRAQYISDNIMAALAAAPAKVKLLVIEASGMIAIDYTGSQILQQTIARLRSRSIDVAIGCWTHGPRRRRAEAG
jgi:hypothetical protein